MLDEALFAPLGFTKFRSEYWPERAVLLQAEPRRNALVETHLATLADLAATAARHPDDMKVSGVTVGGRYTERGLRPEELDRLPPRTSVCIGGVHTRHEWLGGVVGALGHALGVPTERMQGNAYYSPINEGFPFHFDNREVFVVQLRGVKRWCTAPNTQYPYPSANYVAGTIAVGELATYCQEASPASDAVQSFLMNPGDALFLPRGTWHATTALADSASLTIGLFTETALDQFVSEMRTRLIRDPAWRRPAPRQSGEAKRTDAETSGNMATTTTLLTSTVGLMPDAPMCLPHLRPCLPHTHEE